MRTLIWKGPLVNGEQPNVPCPPATNGIIILVRPEDTPEARTVRRARVASVAIRGRVTATHDLSHAKAKL